MKKVTKVIDPAEVKKATAVKVPEAKPEAPEAPVKAEPWHVNSTADVSREPLLPPENNAAMPESKLEQGSEGDGKPKRDTLQLKRTGKKKIEIDPLTNQVLVDTIMKGNDEGLKSVVRSKLIAQYEEQFPFKSEAGALDNLTLQTETDNSKDLPEIVRELNLRIASFDSINAALAEDTLLRTDLKRARVAEISEKIHTEFGKQLIDEIENQQITIDKFKEFQIDSLKVEDSVEQLLHMEIRQRSESIDFGELYITAKENPTLLKALLNDPISPLEKGERLNLQHAYDILVNKSRVQEKEAALNNISYLKKVIEHLDSKLQPIYQNSQSQELLAKLKQFEKDGTLFSGGGNSGGGSNHNRGGRRK